MLEPDEPCEPNGDAGLFEGFATRGVRQRFAGFRASGWEIPQLTVLAFMHKEEALVAPDHDEREIPCRNRIARQGRLRSRDFRTDRVFTISDVRE